MNKYLFENFEQSSPKSWKQKIQVDLKGADYNKTLLWQTNEGIIVKPFYTKEDSKNVNIKLPKEDYKICQTIFITDEKSANLIALNSLQRGATAIQFIAEKPFVTKILLKNIDIDSTLLYFKFQFLPHVFLIELSKYTNPTNTFYQVDIIGNLAESGNWFINFKEDFKSLENSVNLLENSISISGDLYQNAGANIIQQLAYCLAHANEYLNYYGDKVADKIHFQFATGTNYFHEIAKLRAFRLLWASLLKEYKIKEKQLHLFAQPSLRNKTIYDFNVNMLRTTSECMSSVLGGANTIANISYDVVYAKRNEFGERISRNQLLILKEESAFKNAHKFANGAYYIDTLTTQFAEQALVIFKQIEKGGGFLKQLKEGVIQKKIKENETKEQIQFNNKELILLGTNLHVNKKDCMINTIEIDPFLKKRNIKTLIVPIIRKRLSEAFEKERLTSEKK